MIINIDNEELIFMNEQHRDFFYQKCEELHCMGDKQRMALVYTLGIMDDTRNGFKELYDEVFRIIIPEGLYAGWQSGSTMRLTRLAFDLFNTFQPTAKLLNGEEKMEELSNYSIPAIFCYPEPRYFPYMFQAICICYA